MIDTMKMKTKLVLRSLGLYETARKAWRQRPNLRTLCRNAGYRLAGSTDGLPLPPSSLIHLVANSREIAWFLYSGNQGGSSITHALQRSGKRMEDFQSVLDFGCGCGRIMRHWSTIEGPDFHGSDYNPVLIRWCQQHLSAFAEFKTNNLEPPLDYHDEQFDFIYAISVFTHLTQELQFAWMNELARILVPGGFLLITTHGESRFFQLTPEEQQRFRAGELVIRRGSAVGSNFCGAYHPENYVRNSLSKGFSIVDFIPRGARDANQDIYLLQKS